MSTEPLSGGVPSAHVGDETGGRAIYLAARYSRNDEMRGVRDVLSAIGYRITSRWIDQHNGELEKSFTPEALSVDPEGCAPFGIADVEDLRAADIVVSFTSRDAQCGRVVMTPDERLDEIEQGWNTPYDCRVCIGLSPSWDGHDRSCRGRVWESVPWLIGQLRDARAEVEALQHGAAAFVADKIAPIQTERDDLRAELAAERAKVEAVRALHHPMRWQRREFCDECVRHTSPMPEPVTWPCPTARALAGDEQIRTTISNTSTPPEEYYR